MKVFLAFLFSSALLALASCTQNESLQEEIPVIDISDNAESQILELSDVMIIDKIVVLETTVDNLVPQSATLIPAGKYLLINENGNKRLHQYSKDGKFIRFLLTAGGGPNEFRGISAYTTDTINQIFYYSHFGDKEHVAAVNMETGNHLERIKLPVSKSRPESDISGTVLSSLFLRSDNTLACVPRNPEGVYAFFSINTQGNFLSGIPSDSAHFRFAAQQLGGDIHFSRISESDADTVYTVMDNHLAPTTILKFSSRDLQANETLTWEPLLETPTKFMVSQRISSVTYRDDGSISGNRVDRTYFLIDKQTGSSVVFSKYKIGFLGGMEFTFNQARSLGRNVDAVAVQVDAFDFRKHAQEVLKKNDLDPEIRERLEKLMTEVTDDSNPIILIGRLK